MAIVPVQTPVYGGAPISTGPPMYNGYNNYNGGYSGGGGLGRRVSNLEDLIAKIRGKHKADEARDKVTWDEEEKKKKEKEEEDRRLQEKKDREEMHSIFAKELNTKLDVINIAVGKKDKDKGDDEIAKLREKIKMLKNSQQGGTSIAAQAGKKSKGRDDEITKLREERDCGYETGFKKKIRGNRRGDSKREEVER
ncbi:hypothetical protein CBR_g17127 [Chara braunii]|uniref:Uncharacterized protein n=1 Tax=Chara braunii TaxID=69332 RepID=A0A388KUV8_CHABU|nr:hypothetical protein CBR_g17127 [Chara braunii]|eukprot:GBG73788.1 hypothetical protein CBR_g17127 [Chara braunii]